MHGLSVHFIWKRCRWWGGDLAVKQPWRLTHAWLAKFGIQDVQDLPPYVYLRGLENGADAIANSGTPTAKGVESGGDF